MKITVDPRTALRAILQLFDACGPDGQATGDVESVEIRFLDPVGGESVYSLYDRRNAAAPIRESTSEA